MKNKVPIMQFGSYPQSEVKDSALISVLNNTAGQLPTPSNHANWTDYGYYVSSEIVSYMWYIDLVIDNHAYRGVYSKSYRPIANSFHSYSVTKTSSHPDCYQKDHGYTIDHVYWFKYEPITWRVLDVQSGKAFIMASLVLDSQNFHSSTTKRTINGITVNANDYKESYIRAWLNHDFYNVAFNSLEKDRIKTTLVDNSPVSTGNTMNPHECADTYDKVFLLSYAEFMSNTYRLKANTPNCFLASDYAKSQGIYPSSSGYSWWWLRSPESSYNDYAHFVLNADVIDSSDVDRTYYGVVPALWISL